MRRILPRLALLAFLGLGPVACNSEPVRGMPGPETGATLEGTVTYGGQKLQVALVIAQNSSGQATGFIGDDGRYKLVNVPLGEVSIGVNTDAGKGQLMSRMMSQSKGKGRVMPRVMDVPAKYFEAETSGLKTTVNKGENTFDIVIK